ncbi:MAG: hypothetical protein HS115_07930 [Spirochaetales bacterium]|nr:hypothetical protein [Spirochaetales bacterium]
MKSWQPEQIKRSDLKKADEQKKANLQNNGSATPAPGINLPTDAEPWAPDQEFGSVDFAHDQKSGRASFKEQPVSGSLRQTSDLQNYQRGILADFVRQYSSAVIHRLRSLYFQKATSDVHPHEEIVAVLGSLDEATLIELLTILSPAERKNMFALVRKYRVRPALISVFMEKVRSSL